MTHQDIQQGMQHTNELVIEWWTPDKQAKWLKPFWYRGQWLKYKYGEAWQIDYIMPPQIHHGEHHVLTMVEVTDIGQKNLDLSNA